jgi:hypothetical protein
MVLMAHFLAAVALGGLPGCAVVAVFLVEIISPTFQSRAPTLEASAQLFQPIAFSLARC